MFFFFIICLPRCTSCADKSDSRSSCCHAVIEPRCLGLGYFCLLMLIVSRLRNGLFLLPFLKLFCRLLPLTPFSHYSSFSPWFPIDDVCNRDVIPAWVYTPNQSSPFISKWAGYIECLPRSQNIGGLHRTRMRFLSSRTFTVKAFLPFLKFIQMNFTSNQRVSIEFNFRPLHIWRYNVPFVFFYSQIKNFIHP